jgi:hypothetical protein
MKKLTQLTLLLLLTFNFIMAQLPYNQNWLLGRDYDKTLSGREGVLIDFTNDTISISKSNFAFDMFLQNITWSNKDGELQYYFNGCSLAKADHTILANNFNPGYFYNQRCVKNGNLGYSELHQSCLALPLSEKNIYLLHQSIDLIENPFKIYTDKLYLSEIKDDEVVLQNHILFKDTLNSGTLTSTYNPNDSCWWILKNIAETNQYYSFCINSDTIFQNDIQSIGNPHIRKSGTTAKFNSSGDLYATYNPIEGVHLYDFNTETGKFTNFKHIETPPRDSLIQVIQGSLEFSPSGQYLYFNEALNIYQLDLWADDIQATLTKVAINDRYVENSIGQWTTFGHMELGPDCRIWISTVASMPYMHVIMQPDKHGVDCDVQQHAIKLPYPHYVGIPHYPNYSLVDGQPRCDSSKVLILNGVTTATFDPTPIHQAKIFPNPSHDFVTIEPYLDLKSIIIYDQLGHQVVEDSDVLRGKTYSTSGWTPGIYVIHLLYKDGYSEVRKIIKL